MTDKVSTQMEQRNIAWMTELLTTRVFHSTESTDIRLYFENSGQYIPSGTIMANRTGHFPVVGVDLNELIPMKWSQVRNKHFMWPAN